MTTGRTIFLTTELDPHVPGGAGAVVDLLATRLVEAGRSVTVVLVTDEPSASAAVPDYDLVIVGPHPDGDDPRELFLARSRAGAAAVHEVARAGSVERIEVQDFDGLGYELLLDRERYGVRHVPVTVRWHGPVLAMAPAIGARHPEWDTVEAMERGALHMADAVLVPSEAVGEDVVRRTDVPAARIVVAQPPLPRVTRIDRAPAARPEFVALGRLSEVKGSQDLVAAAAEALPAMPGARLRFIGADGWSVSSGRPMREWLEELVPVALRDRIVFEPAVKRHEIAPLIASAWAVVVPSRYESFCLSAHEARAMGLPVIVPDLPAFRDLLHEDTGAVVYDGSSTGLVAALHQIGDDRLTPNALGRKPLPAYRDPLATYFGHPPEPRHPREQAGEATAAGKDVERTLERGQSTAVRSLAKAVLRRVPTGAARAAVRVLPAAIKDRFRDVASWPEEAERRDRERRSEDLQGRIAAGEFPEVDAPDVTVVIPVYNQGDFLAESIASVFLQTHGSWEIVVVDDGSDDPETTRVVADLDLPRVRVIRQTNRGLPAARNAGMAAARGRYLVPLDADDELAPGFLERLLRELETRPDAAFAHCWAELFGDVDAIWVGRPFNRYQLLLSNSIVGCVLLRREAWEQAGGYDERLTRGNEDWDLWVRLDALGWEQVEVRDVLFRYRKHGVSMSVTTEARFDAARRELADRIPELYTPEALGGRKAEYPLVSVVVSGSSDLNSLRTQDLDDLELVSRGLPPAPVVDVARERGWLVRIGDPDDAGVLGRARGKTVIDWDLVTAAAPDAVRRLAEAIEADDEVRGAGPIGVDAAVLWRRWSLVDQAGPDAEAAVVDVDLEARPTPWTVGVSPLAGWDLSLDLGDLSRVQRQRPEEGGTVPAWVRQRWGTA